MKRLMMIGSKTGDLRLYCKQSQTLRIEIKILRIEIKILNLGTKIKISPNLGALYILVPKKKKNKYKTSTFVLVSRFDFSKTINNHNLGCQ